VLVIGPYKRMRRGDPGVQTIDHGIRNTTARLEEAVGLARSIDLTVAEAIIAPVANIRPATYIGKGKVEEFIGLIKANNVGLVVMDCALSPIQQRNLEKEWNVKVIDRTGLILEIFGRRAKTKEGSLQVELAHLNYQRSRLVRSWTHLERQRGGFGFLGGPGETQIEADRRLISERITRLENDIKKVQATRRLHRAGRQRVPYRVVALVGYTNAGKSTLFNRLTRADVQAADMLFATLDPTLRALTLPHGGKAMLSDTVGFISELPTMLVAAFRATLEEVVEADVILHIRDISHEDAEAQQHDVDAILNQLGVDPKGGQRILEVWNKIDRFDPNEREIYSNIAARQPSDRPCFLVSAQTGEGLDTLLSAIEDRIAETKSTLKLSIDASDGAGISWLHRNAEVLAKDLQDGKFVMTVRVDETKRAITIDRFRAVPSTSV
jgi:GTP-binding protein HflX